MLFRSDGATYAGTTGLPFAGGVWRPDRIVRRGTFHRMIGGRLISFAIEAHLVPLAGRAGFLVALTVRNRSERRIRLEIRPRFQPGCPDAVSLTSYHWDWPPPGNPVAPVGADEWRNERVRLRFFADTDGALELGHGAEAMRRFAVLLEQPGEATSAPPDLTALEREAEQDWQRRLDDATARLPVFASDIPDLEAYWRGALTSGLVCLWDHPGFAVRPFPATLGIEGAGLVCYLWDLGGYVPHVASMLLRDTMRPLLEALLALDLSDRKSTRLNSSHSSVSRMPSSA